MKAFLAAIEPNVQSCADCSVRPFSICASLDEAEMQQFEHLSRHAHFAPCETVFAEEEMTTSFYNLLEGVMGSTSCCPMAAGRLWDLPCPAIFWA